MSDDLVKYANQPLSALFRVPHDEVIGKQTPNYFVHPKQRDAMMKELAQSGSTQNYELQLRRPDGSLFWALVTLSMIEFDNDPSVMASIYNVSEQKRAEEKLRESRSKLAEAQRIGHMGDWEFDVHRDMGSFSAETYRIFGVSEDYGTSFKSFLKCVHPEDREIVKNANRQAIERGGFSDAQYRVVRPDGEVRFVQASGEVETDQTGKPKRLFGSILDITPSKKAERFVQNSNAVLEMIASGEPASAIYDEIALMYEARNPGMRCSMLVLQGDRLMHGGAPSLPPKYCNAVNGLKNDPNIGSCGTSAYTGKRVLVEDIATDPKWTDLKGVALPHGLRCCWSEPIKSVSGKVLGAFGMYYNHPALPNETELADLESAARLAGIVMERSNRQAMLHKLSQAIDHAGSSMLITNREGIIEYVNLAFTRLTGYSAEDVVGKTPRVLKSGKKPAEFYESMWSIISSGQVWQGKVVDKRKDGSLFPAMLNIAPIEDEHGAIIYYVGSHADLSELDEMEEKFRQAQKMEAVGTLVGGIAHDFNNMLAGMTGNIYLTKQLVSDMPEVVKKLDNVEQLALRAADMIQQMLTFARKDRVSIKRMPFTPFIKETLKFLRSSVSENIAMHQEISSQPITIEGDATQLHQVLMNLVNNARDALEGVASPQITTRLDMFHADAGWVEHHVDATSELYAHLSVADNGCGIPERQIEHLFEPFFTTKEVGKGTGLGLAMVFGAIKTHHGFIDVESAAGKGSTFHVYLPLPEPEEAAAVASGRDGQVCEGHGETILLADDEPNVLETGKEVLESLGYRVLTARNGEQAVALFMDNSDSIDLCLFDIIMPVMGGDQAANSIRKVRPDMKIIFATGYDKNTQDHLAKEVVISKPFSVIEMSRLIRQQLDN